MKLIPRQENKNCLVACSEKKVNAGFCDCINRMNNEELFKPINKCFLYEGILNEAHAKCNKCGKEEWQH